MTENQSLDTHVVPGQSELVVDDFDDFLAELQEFEPGMRPTSPKRPRRTYDDKELGKLEAVFAANPYPDRAYRNALATEMRVEPKNIQIWFQNRRARERLLRRKAEGVVENPIDRMRVQLAQAPSPICPQYSMGTHETQKPQALGHIYNSSAQGQERHPLRAITNVQSVVQATSHHQSQLEAINLQSPMDDCSSSDIWQQEPGNSPATSSNIWQQEPSNSPTTSSNIWQQVPSNSPATSSNIWQQEPSNSPTTSSNIWHQQSGNSLATSSNIWLQEPGISTATSSNIWQQEPVNSPAALPYYLQQNPEPCGRLSALPTSVVARLSRSSISSLSEISNSSFSELMAAMNGLEDQGSPNCDFVFEF